MNHKLQGVFCPLTTPFRPDGTLALYELEQNVKKYASTRVSGYLILGSNGENKSVRAEEKKRVIKTVIGNKGKNQTAMVASIFESTGETIEFALAAEELGADFITLLPPSYFKKAMTDEALIRYFTDVASALHIPCLLYNAPQFSGGVSLSALVVAECAKHGNILGMKDSSGDIQKQLLAMDGGKFTILSGSANTFMDSLLLGAAGGVISLANYLPEIVVELYQYIMKKDFGRAAELNRMVLKANNMISGRFGVAGVKAAMDMCGYTGGVPRMPLLPLKESDHCRIRDALALLPRI
jgi:4-hydroxy-2-oxoglutarate aldolase